MALTTHRSRAQFRPPSKKRDVHKATRNKVKQHIEEEGHELAVIVEENTSGDDTQALQVSTESNLDQEVDSSCSRSLLTDALKAELVAGMKATDECAVDSESYSPQPAAPVPSSAPTTPTRPPLLSPKHQKVVTLFAGKRRGSSSSSEGRAISPANAQPPATSTQNRTKGQKPPERTTTPPKLLLPDQVCPRIHRPLPPPINTHGCYQQVLPAPIHQLTGYAVVSPDAYSPSEVTRGFEVPGTTPPPSTPRRRMSSASRYLDRDGDIWEKYYSKNLSLDVDGSPSSPSTPTQMPSAQE